MVNKNLTSDNQYVIIIYYAGEFSILNVFWRNFDLQIS
jgi:hypothetical protein